mmetsp:Transcript_87128/g.202842  ORF Transcript_87128/g.202842 Transcript_87128/m.202842 type:complete len:100 (-) Transcript_87128:106-405(-)
MVLCKVPNQHSFCNVHFGIPLGAEDETAIARRLALDREIQKTEKAHAGISGVLKKAGHAITEAQLDSYAKEHLDGVDLSHRDLAGLVAVPQGNPEILPE